MNSALLEGINYSFEISTFIAIAGLLLSLFIKKPDRPVGEAEKEEIYKRTEVAESQ